MKYAKDEFGKDILLKDDSLQVMMEWEKPYMEACIDVLKPHGDVLEIGFGLGYSSDQIQKHHPKSHTIIECDPAVIQKAKDWAKKYPNTIIVEGTWQDKLQQVKVFDTIFFDDYAPLSLDELKQLQDQAENSQKVVQEVQKLTNSISESLDHFKGIKFSDTQIEEFVNQILKRPNVHPEQITDFLQQMSDRGHITPQQSAKYAKEVKAKQKGEAEPREDLQLDWINKRATTIDRFLIFVEACLDQHMRTGSRLSAFMSSADSKLQHKDFKERILSRKDVKYSEKKIPINVPKNCRYFEGNEALVMVIEKK